MRLTLRKLILGGTAVGVIAALIATSLVVHQGSAEAASSTVTIKSFAYGPSLLTVAVGDTVVFQNDESSVPHTVTSDTGVVPAFDTGNIPAGTSKSITFSAAGTFAYHCTIHPSMHGTLVVLQAGVTPTATTPASTATTVPTATRTVPSSTQSSPTVAVGPPATGNGDAGGGSNAWLVLLGLALAPVAAATGAGFAMSRRNR